MKRMSDSLLVWIVGAAIASAIIAITMPWWVHHQYATATSPESRLFWGFIFACIMFRLLVVPETGGIERKLDKIAEELQKIRTKDRY